VLTLGEPQNAFYSSGFDCKTQGAVPVPLIVPVPVSVLVLAAVQVQASVHVGVQVQAMFVKTTLAPPMGVQLQLGLTVLNTCRSCQLHHYHC
jgi:hypothetical protein